MAKKRGNGNRLILASKDKLLLSSEVMQIPYSGKVKQQLRDDTNVQAWVAWSRKLLGCNDAELSLCPPTRVDKYWGMVDQITAEELAKSETFGWFQDIVENFKKRV